MDLRHLPDEPTDEERLAIDAVLGPAQPDEGIRPPQGLRAVASRRHLLLPALHAAQARRGWVSRGALGYICRRLEVPPAEAWGVASFYALFALAEQPPVVAHLCDDVACKLAGADALREDLRSRFGEPGTAREHGTHSSTWARSPCLGLCEQAPAVLLQCAGERPREALFGHASVEAIVRALETCEAPARAPAVVHQAGEASLRLLRRVGRVDPTSLDDYRAHGGYGALRRALEIGPLGVIREVSEAGLVGRGGAAFPTGRKWEAVARAPVRPHYLVCNADESETGTFKDRVLMEEDPFALVEAMTIAGYAIGAEKAYLYVRAEYPLAYERLNNVLAQARRRGLLGEDVMGRGVRFDIEIRRGAGAYICGEETALFNSIEGYRGEPRTKPPFPVEVGLFGKPTVVNNVETLANVIDIVQMGASAWRAVGTPGSPGTRLFCLSGHVARPGVYEVPFGTTLRALIDLAGGVREGRRLKAVLLGGAAGTFVGPEELELPLTFEDSRKAGVTLGSGVVMVFDERAQILPVLARIAEFFRDESCGQCVPCRVGTVRQEEIVMRLVRQQPRGGSREGELLLLRELGQAMRDASICGLGQSASSAIESAVARLRLWENAGGESS